MVGVQQPDKIRVYAVQEMPLPDNVELAKKNRSARLVWAIGPRVEGKFNWSLLIMSNKTIAVLSNTVKSVSRVQPPAMYSLIFVNDEVTAFDFVVEVLCAVCGKTVHEAESLTIAVHEKGHAIVGIYPMEIAEMRQSRIIGAARAEGYPLQVVLEPAPK